MFILRVFMPFIVKIGSPKFRRWILEWTPYQRLQTLKDISDLLEKTVNEILKVKKEALAEGDDAVTRQVGEGKDIMSVLCKKPVLFEVGSAYDLGLLVKANLDAPEEDRIPDEDLLGHMSTFIFAAMNTTSHAVSRVLHQLSINQDIQFKLRQEILEARENHGTEGLSYDDLMNLPYLDAVYKETLRLFPPVPFIGRRTQKPINMPLSTPIIGNDGSEITSIPIPAQSTIIIGILASNTNRKLWGDDAHDWKPERWLKPLSDELGKAVIPGIYSNLMTFLGGGRACIGYKFAEMEIKLILFTLLESFEFDLPADKEILWNIAGIQYPTVGKASTKEEMPLRITLRQRP